MWFRIQSRQSKCGSENASPNRVVIKSRLFLISKPVPPYRKMGSGAV